MTVYVDTSAMAKLLVEESESAALAAHLDRLVRDDAILSSTLLETELRRLAVREMLPQVAVSAVLDRIDLVEPDRSLFYEAGILPGPGLRSLDALHVVTAVRLGVDAFVVYDVRMAAAATSVGLVVIAPS